MENVSSCMFSYECTESHVLCVCASVYVFACVCVISSSDDSSDRPQHILTTVDELQVVSHGVLVLPWFISVRIRDISFPAVL